jgi:inosine-uridine nucleoside N-ribohydrolase
MKSVNGPTRGCRQLISAGRLALGGWFGLAALSLAAAERIPVIVDTDIGDDFDDCWALVTALKSSRLDLKLITTCYGKSDYRAKLVARYLTVSGRTSVPIGLGSNLDHGTGEQLRDWLKGVALSDYPGGVHADGPQAIVELVNASREPVTVVALGPMDTLAAALRLDPGIAAKANLVGMLGSIRIGYGQKPGAVAEYNVKSDIPSAQRVLSAPWKSLVITPLDTAGAVFIDEPRFKILQASSDPLLTTLLSGYRAYVASFEAQYGRDRLVKYGYPPPDRIVFSDVCYDVVGVYLADPDDRGDLNFESLRIKVTDDGFTRIDPEGSPMKVATSWKAKERFLDRTVKILASTPSLAK